MRFLCNENFPLKSVHLLRESGLDVTAVIEDSPGITDEEVLQRARKEQRIILTFDRDYGQLIFKRKRKAPRGIVYLRFVPETPQAAAEYILKLLNRTEIKMEGFFTVGETDQIRQRKLPD